MGPNLDVAAAVVPQARDRRRHKRADLRFRVRFEVLGGEDALRLLRGIGEDAGVPSGEAWYVRNLSDGGLGLRGPTQALDGQAFKEGAVLKLEILPPRGRGRMRCLGEVSWVEVDERTGSFRAGVSFVGVDPRDLEALRGESPEGLSADPVPA